MLLVGAAIVVFMASTAYSVHKQIRGGEELSAIKNAYFPVLQRLDANIVRVDKVQDIYVQMVATGDRDLLAKANDICAETDRAFDEINTLYPGRETDIARLRFDLKQYHELATKVSVALLDSPDSDITHSSTSMIDVLTDFKTHLAAQRQSTYNGFVKTLAASQHDAAIILYMGLTLGMMNLGFMAVLVHFIRDNIKMMSVIAKQNATLEQRVAERTAQLNQKTTDINAMLQNMKLGVATIGLGNLIHPEYSRYLSTIFNQENLGGKELMDTLLANCDLGLDVKNQIIASIDTILGEDTMMFEFNSHLLPREIRLQPNQEAQKIVQLDWNPIANERGRVEKILLITQDVTHLRELEHCSVQQKDEMKIISRILKISAVKFDGFVESTKALIAENRRSILAARGREAAVIAALFRNMHTLKGNARTFELTHITDAAHRAEETYGELRDDDADWSIAVLIAELDAVETALTRYVRVSEDALGRLGHTSDLPTTRGAFVDYEQLAQLRSMAAKLATGPAMPELLALKKSIDHLGLVSLSQLVSSSTEALTSLAGELCKPTPSIEIVGEDLAFNPQFAETLKSCVMHILRNSLDHGIELPADRKRAHKPERGMVRFESKRRDGKVELCVSDDGRGLALHRLYERGLAMGFFSRPDQPANEVIAGIVFRSGLSTASTVTPMSGRGVGMEAVMTFLTAQGASIRIVLLETPEKLDFAQFMFVIDVPTTAMRVIS